jgi:hypothetical protein
MLEFLASTAGFSQYIGWRYMSTPMCLDASALIESA